MILLLYNLIIIINYELLYLFIHIGIDLDYRVIATYVVKTAVMVLIVESINWKFLLFKFSS